MDKCQHGFNVACLICGFSRIDGNKVWFDWAYQNQQAKVAELQKRFDCVWKVLESYKDKASGSYNEKRIDELVTLLKEQAKSRNTRCSCGSAVLVVEKDNHVVMHCHTCGGQKTKEQIEQALKGKTA